MNSSTFATASMFQRLCLYSLLLTAFVLPLRAQQSGQFGLFGYRAYSRPGPILGNLEAVVMITSCARDATGAVEIPAAIDGRKVVEIGYGAFADCTGITGITLPPTMETIGDRAFLNCTGIIEIHIPQSVTNLNKSAFYGCTGMNSITVAPGNSSFWTTDGMLFSNNWAPSPGLIYCPAGRTGIVHVPQGTQSISGFDYCPYITEVILPDSVRLVVPFIGCASLQAISASPSNPNFTSSGGVLFDRLQTTLVAYPPGLPGGCTVPEGVTQIGLRAFATASELTSISFPSTLTVIATDAFLQCQGLTTLVIPEGVEAISSGAFMGCRGLTSITLPASLRRLYDGVFSGCTGLASVRIPGGITHFYPYVFAGCTGLQSVVLEEGLSIIPNNTFERCTSLTAVSIPSSVTTIYEGAFFQCESLTAITIPDGVTSMAHNAFQDCQSLEAIEVAAGNPQYSSHGGVLFNAAMTTLLMCPEARPGPFTVPQGVTAINGDAFRDCSMLTSVFLPDGLTTIQARAFSNCVGLATITIPASVTEIGDTFENCENLTSINVAPGGIIYTSWDGLLYYGPEAALMRCPEGRSGTCEVADGTTVIRASAFSQCKKLTAVHIPDTVTEIGNYAFAGCTHLASVRLSGDLLHIAEGAFLNCTRLANVPLPEGLLHIGQHAFAGCHDLTTINIPASVTEVGYYVCSGCESLTSINVAPGNAAYTSRNGLLYDAAGTWLLEYPAGRPGICVVPSGTRSVRTLAFAGCPALTGVVFPPEVNQFGAYPFSSCPLLTGVFFLGNSPENNPISFAWPSIWDTAEFTIYYLSGSSGFSSPVWADRTSAEISEAAYPAAAWLLSHGLWYDTPLETDPDGDGISLLASYALNLAPGAGLPVPVLTDQTLSLTFYGARPGIAYRVETSTDLNSWTTAGVTQSAPDANGMSTSSVPRVGPARFLRLAIQRSP